MRKIKFALMSISFILLMSCQNNDEKSKKEIEAKVTNLYSKQESIYEVTRDSLFSKELLQKIQKIRDISRNSYEQIEKSDDPTAKGIILEGAVYSSLSDGFSKFTIKNVEIKGNTAEANVEFEFNSTPVAKWTDKVLLINENGWKIDNVIFDTKLNPHDNLNEKLDPSNFDDKIAKDVITNSKGERLKVVYDVKNDIYNIDFNSQKATLKKQNSANGEYYSDGIYDLWFKGENVTLSKGDVELFNNGVAEKIDFTEAKNYFVKNNYPDKELHFVKINNESELDKIFGKAATMGKDGTPTKIDFSKNYAIAIIGKTNYDGNSLSAIAYNNIIGNKGIDITVYTTPLEKGKKQSSSSRPSTILILDKKYQGEIKLNAN